MSALHRVLVPAYRACCRSRAAMTRARMSAELSAGSRSDKSLSGTGRTCTCISMRSSSGPEIFLRYFFTSAGVHLHLPDGCPYQPHLHGFIAQISMNFAGYVTRPAVRTMETVPSSSGWRKTSKASTRNSGSSSRNSTPLCARLNSPGIGMPFPPPAMPAALVV